MPGWIAIFGCRTCARDTSTVVRGRLLTFLSAGAGFATALLLWVLLTSPPAWADGQGDTTGNSLSNLGGQGGGGAGGVGSPNIADVDRGSNGSPNGNGGAGGYGQ